MGVVGLKKMRECEKGEKLKAKGKSENKKLGETASAAGEAESRPHSDHNLQLQRVWLDRG